jgi:transcription initiation factor TFIID subunit 15
MGDIPASTNMISSIITSPSPGQDLTANTDFTIQVQVTNLVAGSFTNAALTYYAAPQQLQGGNIVGHTHVTVQSIGSLNTPTPPDPAVFQFFKGINDAGNGQGGLSAAVAGGLPAGIYRVCTMTSASNHQPVLMPVSSPALHLLPSQ